MEQNIQLIKISNLHNVTGLLAHALHTGNNASIKQLLTRIKECVLDIVSDCGFKPQHWRNLHKPKEVFIDPVDVHAFIKLQSSIGSFIHSTYLNDNVIMLHNMQDIEYYLNCIGTQYSIKVTLD